MTGKFDSRPLRERLLKHLLKTPTSDEPVEFASLDEAIADLRKTGAPDADIGQLIENGPGATYIVGASDFRIHYLSDKGREFLPVSLYDNAKKKEIWIHAIRESDRDAYRDAIASLENGAAGATVAYHLENGAETDTLPVVDYLAALRDAGGRAVGYLGRVVDDSFASQTMDTLVKRSWKEVSSIASRRFLHDFNNMIAGIYSLSELYALPGSDAETMTEAMTHIRDSAVRAQKITQKIRALNAMSEGEVSYFDVGKLIEEQRDYLLAMLPKTVDLQLELTDASLPVRLDANRFRQALIHLAGNASDAARDKPKIRIRCELIEPDESNESRPYARIEFHDDGHGIEPANLPLVSQPFFTTKNKQAHDGMGLFIVDQFTRELGGELDIESNPEDGTRVAFTLPLANLTETIPVANADYAEAAPVATQPAKTPTLLIYTWEDITRHPLINSLRAANWKFRIHLDGDQLKLDMRELGKSLDGVLVFKSALDENVDDLVIEIAAAEPPPKLAVVALGESVDAVSEYIRAKCGLLVSGSSKPAGLLKTLDKFFG